MTLRALRVRASAAKRSTRRWINRARLDLADLTAGRHDPMVPLRIYGMPSQLKAVGSLVVNRILIDAAGLRPDERVLDIGCGVGRLAVPLTRHLDRGSYEGFDVMPRSIRWARRKITPRHPNFRFQLADIHNGLYNPEGTQAGHEYRFPFDDEEFDLAFASSVFTHLVPRETIRYLEESARVLKPGGRLVSSFMLLNDEVEEMIADGIPDRPSVVTRPGLKLDEELSDEAGHRYRTPHPHRPEHYVALYEDDLRAWHAAAGLEVDRVIYGSWPGRERTGENAGQDYVIAIRR